MIPAAFPCVVSRYHSCCGLGQADVFTPEATQSSQGTMSCAACALSWQMELPPGVAV